MNLGMIRESNMLAALSVGAEGAVFMWEETAVFPTWMFNWEKRADFS